jgi:hypothetical protein
MDARTLIQAAEIGDTDAVRVLAANGADVNAKDQAGNMALMRAAANGHAETALALLDEGAEIDARRDNGMTALICAAFFGHAAVVRALLDRGANINLKDNLGSTALDWAASRGFTEIVEMLTEAAARGAEALPSSQLNEDRSSGANGEEVLVAQLEREVEVRRPDPEPFAEYAEPDSAPARPAIPGPAFHGTLRPVAAELAGLQTNHNPETTLDQGADQPDGAPAANGLTLWQIALIALVIFIISFIASGIVVHLMTRNAP